MKRMPPLKVMSSVIAGISLLLVLARLAYGALSPEQAAGKLAEKAGKVWVFVRFENILGQEDACKKGETWTFSNSKPEALKGMLKIKRCVDKKVVEQSRSWQIRRKDQIDNELTLSGSKPFILLFPPSRDPNIERMTLRVFSKDTSKPTVDRVFTHERD